MEEAKEKHTKLKLKMSKRIQIEKETIAVEVKDRVAKAKEILAISMNKTLVSMGGGFDASLDIFKVKERIMNKF